MTNDLSIYILKSRYMQAIEVSHLIKKFGPLTALNDISFSVGEGETFGFLGPNGAGKTTTIRILTGISRPTSGTATIFGHDIEHDTIAARQSMGIVSENSNVYDDLTAWQNMMFSAELYHVGRKEREKKADELLKKFELYERRNDKAHGFSKGMKRRLTLAWGLVNSPPSVPGRTNLRARCTEQPHHPGCGHGSLSLRVSLFF